MGKRQTNALNLLVLDFEDNLGEIYLGLPIEKAYQAYMADLLTDKRNLDKYQFQSKKTNSEFHKSGLWNEVYEYNYTYSLDSSDSTKTINVNNLGKYMQALYSVKDSDSLIYKYFEKREAAGIMQNEIVINGLLSLNGNFNDYFHKRIVVMEFSF